MTNFLSREGGGGEAPCRSVPTVHPPTLPIFISVTCKHNLDAGNHVYPDDTPYPYTPDDTAPKNSALERVGLIEWGVGKPSRRMMLPLRMLIKTHVRKRVRR